VASGTIEAVYRARNLQWMKRLAALGAAVVLGGCGATVAGSAAPPVASTTVASSAPAPASESGPDTPAIAAAPAGSVYVATATVPSLPIYVTPRALGPGQTIANPNPLGAPLTLLVKAVQGGWLEVYLPERPNEFTGWVPQTDVTLATDAEHIVVSLGARKVTLYRNGAQVDQATVAVGSPDSPTPMGHFFVTEVLKLTDPGDAYGPYALGLSGFSNTYFSFDGGPGQIAIHGTNQPQVIGGYASHGCVRLTNPDITTLATQVPAGTPVDIVA
jgi:lipoprotein-anchoring transpeptidase ErfK/SrfK